MDKKDLEMSWIDWLENAYMMKELQTSWKNPASTRVVTCTVEVFYPLDEADKVGLNRFPPIGQKLVALAFYSGLAMTEDPAFPNKQSRVTETLLRKRPLQA
ncbi:hypothetical protein EOD39_11214 [Acipenser ruthenus]|uniref:Uncharacterized protein n=1 Tax=Acipenser ruthenus TaxID=7906 RepID=A0A662YS87_ACIRT|nr:hypothetical protein EOD39_11214 [Acipenser ruthenus]